MTDNEVSKKVTDLVKQYISAENALRAGLFDLPNGDQKPCTCEFQENTIELPEEYSIIKYCVQCGGLCTP